MKPGYYVAIVPLVLLCFIGLGPFYTIHELRDGVKNGDSEKIADNVDFIKVREGIKDQLNAKTMQAIEGRKADGWAMLGSLFAGVMIDKMITPSGLAMMLKGERTPLGRNVSTLPATKDPLSTVRYAFDSFSKFSAYVPDKRGHEMRIVLSRDWFSWKVTNVVFPLE
ncbi:DUF2939 domain-containing protein [Larkinella insperata]|uniref:DUF2939 domain-containing protein n=1 Tax=Larkinella insperata TaxID=332158 RepID=A0ABW3QKS8_9BACT